MKKQPSLVELAQILENNLNQIAKDNQPYKDSFSCHIGLNTTSAFINIDLTTKTENGTYTNNYAINYNNGTFFKKNKSNFLLPYFYKTAIEQFITQYVLNY